jgi:hypothetical protein
MKCPHCDKAIDDDSKFCGHCGQTVAGNSDVDKEAEELFELFRKHVKKDDAKEKKFQKEHVSEAMQQLMNNVANNQLNSLMEEHPEIKNLPHKSVEVLKGLIYVAGSYGLELYVIWKQYKDGHVAVLTSKPDIELIRTRWKKRLENYAKEIQKFPDPVDRVIALLRNHLLSKFKEDHPSVADLPHKAYESIESSIINAMLWSFWMAEIEGDEYR